MHKIHAQVPLAERIHPFVLLVQMGLLDPLVGRPLQTGQRRVSARHAYQVHAQEERVHADYDTSHALFERLAHRLNVADSQAERCRRGSCSVDAKTRAEHEEPVEIAVVARANAVAHKRAVMIEALHAHVARGAVNGTRRPVEFACGAELAIVVAVFDVDCLVFGGWVVGA